MQYILQPLLQTSPPDSVATSKNQAQAIKSPRLGMDCYVAPSHKSMCLGQPVQSW